MTRHIPALTILALAAAFAAPAARASDVPNFDSEKLCRNTMARIGGNSLGRVVADCVRDETAARDRLRNTWDKFAAADRASCAGLTTAGLPSYTELLTCLEMKRDARALKSQGAATDGLGLGLEPRR